MEFAIKAQVVVSIVFYVFGIGGVLVAFISLWVNRRNQREANARRAYLDYARLGIEYPDFAFPPRMNIDLNMQTVNGSKQDFERYEWFVSITLATVRFFLELVSETSMWRQMMILQLAYHWEHLDRFRNEKEYLKRWAMEMNAELDEAIALGRRLYPRQQRT